MTAGAGAGAERRARRRWATLGDALRADAGRGLALATVGCAVLAVVELIATVHGYPAHPSIGAVLRLAAVDVSLIGLAWVVIAPLTALAVVAPRLWRAWFGAGDDDARVGDGALVWAPRVAAAPPGVAWLWSIALAAVGFLFAVQRLAYFAVTHFKEQQLLGLYVAVGALAAAVAALVALRALRRAFAAGGALLYPTTGRWTPLTSWPGALLGLAAVVGAALAVALVKLPQLRPLVPWRLFVSAAAFAAGMALGAWLLARRGALWPATPARRRRAALIASALALVLVPSSLLYLGADQETRSIAVTSSPTLARLIDLVRRGNDFDGDGFGSLLGENDCGPFRASIHPGVRDLPDNGIDENCDGRDFSLRDLRPPKPGEVVAVPRPFQRPWNVLLITIDTVRYDHTTFGGYATGPKKRNTTPNLDKLARRSTLFTFANAPSAGTMASVPAIITSKFFHSGIALDEKVARGMPPKLKPENTLIGEIMKRGGYTTGAILSHEYFNDWGMNQGIDEYDNSIGKVPDAFRVTSQVLTDHALAWISRHTADKWFLWVHYLDPHGRYVAHPDDIDYGASEEDLYDGELAYTDKHLGRLFDELARLPNADRTIVVVTSDHGDGFNEHGFINHGQALYRELLHVPLIVYVPDNEPRQIAGAVSPLDIVPTIAALCGIDVSDLSFEGQSLLGAIFYGKQDLDRVVFAETNWPKPLRAAVSSRWKLIENLQNNLYELFDLQADPWEKNNLANRGGLGDAASLKDGLDRWLERVVYSRDALYNQAAMRMADVLVATRPTPTQPSPAVRFDGGKLAVLGITPRAPSVRAGDKLEVDVFFEAVDKPSAAFRFQLAAWPADQPGSSVHSAPRLTLDGMFATDRWRKGEFIREHFSVAVPADWTGGPVTVAIGLSDPDGKRLQPAGPTAATDPTEAIIGSLPLEAAPTPTAPTPAAPTPSPQH